jgi:hypothetical protein
MWRFERSDVVTPLAGSELVMGVINRTPAKIFLAKILDAMV